MRVLLHIGLNKCASTAIQGALDRARPTLAAAGIWYPDQPGPPCQYGLSKAMGFGPDAGHITGQRPGDLVAEARRRDCAGLILSSEYLSLYRPAAAGRLWVELGRLGCQTTIVMFSREITGWVRSLFNQYVRTVEGGRYLADIDAFVGQVLANGAIDVARRHAQWAALAGPEPLHHYRLPPRCGDKAVLTPFASFAGVPIGAPPAAARNTSIGPDALYRIGQLRQQPASIRRESEIEALLAGAPPPREAPERYLEIGPDALRRLEQQVIGPYRALPWLALPEDPALAKAGRRAA